MLSEALLKSRCYMHCCFHVPWTCYFVMEGKRCSDIVGGFFSSKCVLAVSNHQVSGIPCCKLFWVSTWCVASVWATWVTLHKPKRILQLLHLLSISTFVVTVFVANCVAANQQGPEPVASLGRRLKVRTLWGRLLFPLACTQDIKQARCWICGLMHLLQDSWFWTAVHDHNTAIW